MSKLGIFDSGLGGYSIANEIHKAYPKQDIVFLADQVNMPYGSKTKKELIKIINNNLDWFFKNDITDVLIACNTSCVLINKKAKMNIYKIIDKTCLQVSDFDELIVLATPITIKSHAYKNALQKFKSKINVHEIALTNLASLIENCASRKEIIHELDLNLKDFKDSKLPVVLGCTHYPIVKNIIKDYVGYETFDSIIPVLNDNIYTDGEGIFEVYTTANTLDLERKLKTLFNQKIKVKKAIINE